MRDPDTIEGEIAVERERLAASLRAIEAHLSPEALVQRVAVNTSDVARDTPLALALIGSGVAWLYASATGVQDDATGRNAAPRPHHQEGDKTMPMTGTGLHDPDTQFNADQDTREGLRRTAEDLRARLSDGLEAFPDGARARILEARLKAIEAQSAIEAKAARGADTVRRGADDHPLLVGAIAFGLGAAIAAALPRTSAENRTLGAQRDRLVDEADRIFREETAKLRRVAESAVAEGRDAVKDTLQRDQPDEEGPVERVHQATRREARRQHLGEVT
jgi:hypothetical protein